MGLSEVYVANYCTYMDTNPFKCHFLIVEHLGISNCIYYIHCKKYSTDKSSFTGFTHQPGNDIHIILRIIMCFCIMHDVRRIVLFVYTAGVDYTVVPSPLMVNLNNETRTACTDMNITEDKLVEGQEAFEVYFEVVNFFGSYAVNGSDTTMITILDSNG